MRAGQTVTYVDSSGREHRAMVTAVVGTGESLYKRVDLTFTDARGERQSRENVGHERDASGRAVFWREGMPATPPTAADDGHEPSAARDEEGAAEEE